MFTVYKLLDVSCVFFCMYLIYLEIFVGFRLAHITLWHKLPLTRIQKVNIPVNRFHCRNQGDEKEIW